MKRNLAYIIFLACTFVWCALLLLPPLLTSVGFHETSHRMYQVYSPICHQFESRSLHVFGYKLAVCYRCSAIYAGFFFGALMYPFFAYRNPLNAFSWLVVAVVPMVLDVALDAGGLHASGMVTRILSGSFFGIVSSCIFAPAIVDALAEILRKHHTNQEVQYELKT